MWRPRTGDSQTCNTGKDWIIGLPQSSPLHVGKLTLTRTNNLPTLRYLVSSRAERGSRDRAPEDSSIQVPPSTVATGAHHIGRVGVGRICATRSSFGAQPQSRDQYKGSILVSLQGDCLAFLDHPLGSIAKAMSPGPPGGGISREGCPPSTSQTAVYPLTAITLGGIQPHNRHLCILKIHVRVLSFLSSGKC